MVIYQLQALQARRKILREEVDKAKAAVEKLRESAISLHTKAHTPLEHHSIKGMLSDIERRCNLWPGIAAKRRKWLWPAADMVQVTLDPTHMMHLRQAITLEHFDDVSASPLMHDAPQLSQIMEAANDLVLAMDKVLVAALD